jgi:hypothetical protein
MLDPRDQNSLMSDIQKLNAATKGGAKPVMRGYQTLQRVLTKAKELHAKAQGEIGDLRRRTKQITKPEQLQLPELPQELADIGEIPELAASQLDFEDLIDARLDETPRREMQKRARARAAGKQRKIDWLLAKQADAEATGSGGLSDEEIEELEWLQGQGPAKMPTQARTAGSRGGVQGRRAALSDQTARRKELIQKGQSEEGLTPEEEQELQDIFSFSEKWQAHGEKRKAKDPEEPSLFQRALGKLGFGQQGRTPTAAGRERMTRFQRELNKAKAGGDINVGQFIQDYHAEQKARLAGLQREVDALRAFVEKSGEVIDVGVLQRYKKVAQRLVQEKAAFKEEREQMRAELTAAKQAAAEAGREASKHREIGAIRGMGSRRRSTVPRTPAHGELGRAVAGMIEPSDLERAAQRVEPKVQKADAALDTVRKMIDPDEGSSIPALVNYLALGKPKDRDLRRISMGYKSALGTLGTLKKLNQLVVQKALNLGRDEMATHPEYAPELQTLDVAEPGGGGRVPGRLAASQKSVGFRTLVERLSIVRGLDET